MALESALSNVMLGITFLWKSFPDKSGDVLKFLLEKEEVNTSATDEENKGEILLGHLSMLLAVQITPCGNFILTADR